MKTISIIIPVYNVQYYLSSCLNSVIAQRIDGAEIVLVNDGSTDNSLSVCLDFQKDNPNTIIINKVNGGLSDARNAGVEIAEGEWIYFLDSDDRLPQGALKTLFDIAVTEGCDMVAGGYYYDYGNYLLYDDRWLRDKTPFFLSREDAMEALIKQQYLKNFAWGKLYKTDIVKRYPFKKGVYFEDSYWQHLIINDCDKVGIVPEPLYYYRQRANSISGCFSERNLDLLKGNEERLQFVLSNYPELKKDMASTFWRMCDSFKCYAESTGKEVLIKLYSSYYSEVETRYKDLFDTSLCRSIDYSLRDNRPLSSAYRYSKRVWNHLFAKRLKRIEFNEKLSRS